MLWIAISHREKYQKVSNDLDCLPPDAEKVFQVEPEPLPNMIKKAKRLEAEGWHICIDLGDDFYETGEECQSQERRRTMTRQDLLEACNLISQRYGGRHVGTVRGNRNQWLISVQLNGPDIRLGFCQTSIKRPAARGCPAGFPIIIPSNLLAHCRTPDDVLRLFQAYFGSLKESNRAIEKFIKEKGGDDQCK